MKYFVVCTFELREGDVSDYETAYAALHALGLQRDSAANGGDRAELPPDAVVGTYEVARSAPGGDVAFLRNCLSFKLREVFDRHGFDAEFLLVLSQGDCAWERGGHAFNSFAARHGRGALQAAATG